MAQCQRLPLVLQSSVLPCLEGRSGADHMEAWANWNQYVFDVSPGDYVVGSQLPCLNGAGVMVLQGMTFASPGTMVTNLEPISLEFFLENLPKRTKERKPRTTKAKPQSLPQELIAEHPWLAEFGMEDHGQCCTGP